MEAVAADALQTERLKKEWDGCSVKPVDLDFAVFRERVVEAFKVDRGMSNPPAGIGSRLLAAKLAFDSFCRSWFGAELGAV